MGWWHKEWVKNCDGMVYVWVKHGIKCIWDISIYFHLSFCAISMRLIVCCGMTLYTLYTNIRTFEHVMNKNKMKKKCKRFFSNLRFGKEKKKTNIYSMNEIRYCRTFLSRFTFFLCIFQFATQLVLNAI